MPLIGCRPVLINNTLFQITLQIYKVYLYVPNIIQEMCNILNFFKYLGQKKREMGQKAAILSDNRLAKNLTTNLLKPMKKT